MRILPVLCLVSLLCPLPSHGRGAAKPAAKAAPAAKKTKRPRQSEPIVFPDVEGCPRNRKEWQAKGPRLLLEKAQRQHLPIEIPDIAARIGKKGTTASAVPFRGIGAPMVMVEAHDEASGLHLSGVLKCDTVKHAPVLVSLTYVKGEQSGLAKIIEE